MQERIHSTKGIVTMKLLKIFSRGKSTDDPIRQRLDRVAAEPLYGQVAPQPVRVTR